MAVIVYEKFDQRGSSPLSFTQAVASTDWTFSHSLNRVPIVEVTDLVGNRLLVETESTQDIVRVKASQPITGIVYLV